MGRLSISPNNQCLVLTTMLKEITLEITQRCPNYCIHCSSLSSLTCTHQLSFPVIKQAIDDAVELGVSVISISGGEPFIHPDIVEIVRYIHRQNVVCNIYTSGIYHNGFAYSSVPTSILQSVRGYADKLIFNIEAADPLNYETIMGVRGGFDLLITSVMEANKMGFIVESHTVLMKANMLLIPQLFAFCEVLHISRMSFLRLVMQGRALDNYSITYLTDEEISKAKSMIMHYAQLYSGKIRMGTPLSDCTQKINCLAGSCKLDIRYDGNVYPCEAFKNNCPSTLSAHLPQNIHTERLKTIFQRSPYLKDIRRYLEHYQTIKTCEACMSQYYMKLEKGN